MKFNPKKSWTVSGVIFSHNSILLLYLSFITFFIKNNPDLPHLVLSWEGFVILSISIFLQLVFNYFLRNPSNYFVRFIYLDFIILSFTFLNLAYFLTYLGQLNISTNGIVRVRFVLLLYLIVFTIITYYATRIFHHAIRVVNTFLVVFVVTSIFYSDWTFLRARSHVKDNKKSSLAVAKPHRLVPNKPQTETASNKILFIVLDEYSSETDLRRLANPGKIVTSLNSYLVNKGFAVIDKMPTRELSTVNSINEVFNQGSGISFEDKSIENVSYQLREAFVAKDLEERGYSFKNFSFFNIGGNEEFYYLYPFPRNNFETLFKNSMLFLIISNFTFQNLTNFREFQTYADYNKKLYSESLTYLNNLNPSKKEFIYVHFEMPHPPFYSINEFSDRPITLTNYIAYWNFANKKLVDYLGSIKDMESYRVIITGDHGYRRDVKKLDPHITTSAFYNFDIKDVKKISSVQEIGNLLLSD